MRAKVRDFLLVFGVLWFGTFITIAYPWSLTGIVLTAILSLGLTVVGMAGLYVISKIRDHRRP